MSKELNSNKDEKHEAHWHHPSDWNLDPRNENFYLGKITESGDSDLNMRYFTDGKTSRYYRKSEMMSQQENETIVKEPFRNNSLEGKRKKKFSFRLSGKSKKDKE